VYRSIFLHLQVIRLTASHTQSNCRRVIR